jgi:hypothetical protein
MSIYQSHDGYESDPYTQMAVYTLSAGTYSLVTNASTPSVSTPARTPAWYTSNFAVAPTFSAVTYYLVINTQKNTPIFYFNTDSGNNVLKRNQIFGTWPATFTSAGNYETSKKLSIYCTYTAGGGSTYNLTNSPSSIDFGVIQPSTTYYAYGSAPSNPITDGQCTFTITNSQANAIKINIKAANFTGGGGWTLGTPDGTHTRLIAYYSGQNPASGVTLTTSDQVFVASLAGSATLKWDFSWETATSFADGTQKSSTITLTGVAP